MEIWRATQSSTSNSQRCWETENRYMMNLLHMKAHRICTTCINNIKNKVTKPFNCLKAYGIYHGFSQEIKVKTFKGLFLKQRVLWTSLKAETRCKNGYYVNRKSNNMHGKTGKDPFEEAGFSWIAVVGLCNPWSVTPELVCTKHHDECLLILCWQPQFNTHWSTSHKETLTWWFTDLSAL